MKKIKLTREELEYLKDFMKQKDRSARELARAHILLLANEGRSIKEIIEITGTSDTKVYRVKKRYREGGLQSALMERPRTGRPRKHAENTRRR